MLKVAFQSPLANVASWWPYRVDVLPITVFLSCLHTNTITWDTMTTTCNSCTNPLNQFCLSTSTILALHSHYSSKAHFFQNNKHNSLHLAQFSWRKSFVFTRTTLTRRMGKHLSHTFTISNQSFSIKGLFWSNGLEAQAEAEPEEWE